jgi:hypothetical protein
MVLAPTDGEYGGGVGALPFHHQLSHNKPANRKGREGHKGKSKANYHRDHSVAEPQPKPINHRGHEGTRRRIGTKAYRRKRRERSEDLVGLGPFRICEKARFC